MELITDEQEMFEISLSEQLRSFRMKLFRRNIWIEWDIPFLKNKHSNFNAHIIEEEKQQNTKTKAVFKTVFLNTQNSQSPTLSIIGYKC